MQPSIRFSALSIVRIIVGRNSEQANVELPTKNDSPVNLQSFWYTFGFCGVYLTDARCFYTCSTRTQIGFNLDAAPTNSTRKFAVGALRACVRSTANSSSLLSSTSLHRIYTGAVSQHKTEKSEKRSQARAVRAIELLRWQRMARATRTDARAHPCTVAAE